MECTICLNTMNANDNDSDSINKVLTLKRENINNIDKKFSNYLTKIYWLRRYEQHNLTKEISNKQNFIDRFLTIIFMKIFN